MSGAAGPAALEFPCPLCTASAQARLLTGYDRAHPRAEDFEYYRCTGCGLVRLLPPLPAERLHEFYPDDYASHAAPAPWQPRTGAQRLAVRCFYGVESLRQPALLRAAARMLSERMMRDLCEPRGECRLLDVGCGSGGLMRRHRTLGWSVVGIEPSASACAMCAEAGLEVHRGTLFEAPLDGREFDVILLHHVIEHLPDPVAALRRLARVLAPDGRIILRTPNARSLGLRLFGSCWKALEAPRHLFLFDPRTIRLLGLRAGLHTLRVVTRPEARMLAESRQYRKAQGEVLPPGLELRRSLVESPASREEPSRVFRKLISPVALAASMLQRGEALVVEMAAEA